jgi:Ser/Thr protein kinase RdoA (MazF antagonist)
VVALAGGHTSVLRLEEAEIQGVPDLLLSRAVGSVLWRAAHWRRDQVELGEVTYRLDLLEARARWPEASPGARRLLSPGARRLLSPGARPLRALRPKTFAQPIRPGRRPRQPGALASPAAALAGPADALASPAGALAGPD